MTEDRTAEYQVLEKEIIEIGERSRERHREIFLRNVDHPETISALENILSYWKYNYRPALIQYSYKAVGGKGHIDSSFAEFFSVTGAGVGIHDDIIDRTYRKRGRLTIPGIYGPDLALTIGDLLLVKGLTSISGILKKNINPEIVEKILEAYESFFTEMCIGEVMEIQARKNRDLTLEEYHEMLWKLGIDSEVCTKIGAIVGQGASTEINLLAQFGKNLGYLTRLHDEIDDVVYYKEKLWYRIEFESIPLPILYASKRSKEDAMMIEEILNEKIGYTELTKLFALCYKSGAFDYVKNIAQKTMMDSISLLNRLGENNSLEKLKLICWNLNDEIKKKI